MYYIIVPMTNLITSLKDFHRNVQFQKRILPAGFIVGMFSLYLLAHLLTLGLHPFVHSDEAWLAVLTRAMIVERNPAAVEEVFRITDRYPHAFKTLYHMVQAPFLAVSWSVYSARLPSLIAGFFALFFITQISSQAAETAGIGSSFRFVPGLLMALDPQFWYASHFGRQEMLLTALFLFSWSLKSRDRPSWVVALPLAMAMFVHPNTLIISIPIGVMYIIDFLSSRDDQGLRRKDMALIIRQLSVFITILAGTAALAVVFSLLMDTDFLMHYRSFGDSVGTGDSFTVKLLGLPLFLGKMWNGKAGTYFLADIRPMIILGFMGLLTAAALFRKGSRQKSVISLIVVPISLMAGMVIVGKYGPPTITFLMPGAYILFGFSLQMLEPLSSMKVWNIVLKLVVLLAVITLSIITVKEVSNSIHSPSYSSYLRFLKENISGEGRVLANLNTAFAFEYDRLVIWRDLENLGTGDGCLESLIVDKDVQWIVLPDELELIYSSRPFWNAVYGNPYWYPQLMEVLANKGVEVGSEPFPNYAMRIVPYMYRSQWNSVIYRLQQ